MKDSIRTAEQIEMDLFISDLMSRMTLDEKIGQLNLIWSDAPPSDEVVQKIRNGTAGALLGPLFNGQFGISGPGPLREIQEIAMASPHRIPLLFAFDVIHGHQTVFPIPLGMSSSWDMSQIQRSARLAAVEATANGLNWAFSPMVDISRDPRWGRGAEGSGEDPYLGSRIAEAMVLGYQGGRSASIFFGTDEVMACVKHIAAYGAAEAGRDYNNVDMSLRRLYDIYLPAYLAGIKAGAGSVMMSFNALNGIPAHANKMLIQDFIRKEAKFDGLVVSDWGGIAEMIRHGIGDEYGEGNGENVLQTLSARALKAGLQMDMMSHGYSGTLATSFAQGKVTQQEIDGACRAVLEAKYKLGLFADPYRYFNEKTASQRILTQAHRMAARELAGDSCVLLKNDNNVLPLSKSAINIAVVGPLANDTKNILGPWSFGARGKEGISVLAGIQNAIGDDATVHYAMGSNISNNQTIINAMNYSSDKFGGDKTIVDPRSPKEMIDEAISVAQASDVIIAVLGEGAEMSGEAASRSDIGIPEEQRDLLKAMVQTGKPVVLVLMNGRPLTLPWERKHVAAILETWFPGTEGGNAIADVLFGDRNPSAKLTMTFPEHVGQIPIYYAHESTGRPSGKAGEFDKYTTSCYLDVPSKPLFPFGYGLSYTSFSYSAVAADKLVVVGKDTLNVSVTITNTGSRAGQEIVQMYVTDPRASITRPVKELKGFEKIHLDPGEAKVVTFAITQKDLMFHNANMRRVWEPGEFIIGVGTNSEVMQTVSVNWLKAPTRTKQNKIAAQPSTPR